MKYMKIEAGGWGLPSRDYTESISRAISLGITEKAISRSFFR
jgi:hypothetical protein